MIAYENEAPVATVDFVFFDEGDGRARDHAGLLGKHAAWSRLRNVMSPTGRRAFPQQRAARSACRGSAPRPR